MTRLGMIVRADHGGLAAQTCEIARHLHPDAVLVVDLGPAGRGPTDISRVEGSGEMRVTCNHPLSKADVGWLLERCDTLFTAETAYHDRMHDFCRAAGVKFVIQANPELHRADRTADVIVNPTNYGADRRDWPLLPVPIPSDRLPRRQRTEPAKVFLHMSAPAMLDRNGTELVVQSLRYVQSTVTVSIAGHMARQAALRLRPPPNVTVERLPPVDNWWETYRDDVDVLLMPRRYAGLCLPAQEAAAAGIPTVALDTAPLRDTCVTVRATSSRPVKMGGGPWPVATCNPRSIAQMIDNLANDGEAMAKASQRACEWAESLSWERLLPEYQRLLR